MRPSTGHDDFAMAAIWALYCLKLEIVERYYDVKKYTRNRLRRAVRIYYPDHFFGDDFYRDRHEHLQQLDRNLFRSF